MNITKATWAFMALLSVTPFANTQDKSCHTPAPEIKFDKTTDCRTLPTRTAMSECAQANVGLKVFHLENATQQNDANEILVAIRNMMDPSTKMFLVASTGDIVTYTYPAETERIAEIIHALDRPHQAFRVTYTFTDADSGEKMFPQASIVVTEGQNTVLKRGDKLPITTEAPKGDNSGPPRSMTSYLDIGLTIDTTVTGPLSRGVSLKYRLEQSALAANTTTATPDNPALHQTSITGVTTIPMGKSTALATIELPDTKHKIVISAMAEPVQ